MISESQLPQEPWWNFLDEDLRELIRESFLLLEKVKEWNEKFHDYAFVVFPAAKGYEGFLKKVFLQKGFITKEDYYGKRFRIGKALNPSLDKQYREKESVYDRIVEFTGDASLADQLWITWKDSRNLIFHWFPDEKKVITLEESEVKINEIIAAMESCYKICNKEQ